MINLYKMEILKYVIALLPVVVWAFYIYKKDSLKPEPFKQLWKAFRYGVGSCFVAIAGALILGAMGLYKDSPTTILEAVQLSFFGAAIPEECAKLFMLWMLMRKKNYVDEWMDGIVYAVFISLGFAALENIMYVVSNEDWLQVGITRALFSIPGHFGFGVLMGYYYALARLSMRNVVRHRILMLAAPILAHGAFDSILFSIQIAPELGVVLFFVFLYVCVKLWKYGRLKVQEHLKRDSEFDRLVDEQRSKN